MTCQRAGVRGFDRGLPRDVCPTVKGPWLCAPRCHARARLLLFWGGGFPVRDRALVGGFGLRGELFLGVAHLLAGGPGAGGLAGADGGAGFDFESAELLGGEGGLLVGVVLLAGEHAPEQDGELASDGDDGDVVAFAGPDALVEGMQRSGL